MGSGRETSKEIRRFDGEEIEVYFRKAAPIDEPGARYPGFKPETRVLPKGYVHQKGALSLPCDILFERDVEVTLRDGLHIYVDIFRPPNVQEMPAIIAWSPYGKEKGNHVLDDFPFRASVPKNAVSELQTWEGPDPAYWCNHGYAVVNADARGVYSSEGDMHFWGAQEGRDGCDLVEWVAGREWCNGKVGLSGNSWLSIAQWFIAAERPSHLAAIAPWEGWCDAYRQDFARGGVLNNSFLEWTVSAVRGKSRVEDVPAMLRKYPFMNAYWRDKRARIENIQIPAYVVASWTSPVHTVGTFAAFRSIPSAEKWLRVHNTQEWPDYYTEKYTDDLRLFFDRYLKGMENGWEKTPRVRLSVLDTGGNDTVDRPEQEFPLARTQYKSLYLDARSAVLTPDLSAQESSIGYVSDDGRGQAVFTYRFDGTTELTGYMKLRLWVEAVDADDADLYIQVRKLNSRGKQLTSPTMIPPNPVARRFIKCLYDLGMNKVSLLFFVGPFGRLRVSHRALDTDHSTPFEPYHTHLGQAFLKPGEIVPVEIGLSPAGMRWHKGEQLQVIISGHNIAPLRLPGMVSTAPYNKGRHIIHTGGKYDSHLLVPVVPGSIR